MNQAQMIHQSSGVTEYHTPLDIVDVARALLGGTIDLDPASNPLANASIRAATIYTRFDDGLSKNWAGRVFMNHPFSSPERACKPNCRKLVCKRRGYCTIVELSDDECDAISDALTVNGEPVKAKYEADKKLVESGTTSGK